MLINKKYNDCLSLKSRTELDNLKNSLITELSNLEFDKKESSFADIKLLSAKLIKNLGAKEKITGFSWGIKEMDIATNGIEEERFIVIGALKKSGKTRFAAHIQRMIQQQGGVCIFKSLEMASYDLMKLQLAAESEISDRLIKSGGLLKKYQISKILALKDQIDWEKMPIETGTLKKEMITPTLRRYSKLYAGCVVIIDFIQRIYYDKSRGASELEEIAMMIGDAVREFKITVIVLSQLANTAESEKPDIGHLKGSGGIAENADIIILLDNIFRRTKKEDDKNKLNITIQQRYGETSEFKVFADLGKCQFKDYSSSLSVLERVQS